MLRIIAGAVLTACCRLILLLHGHQSRLSLGVKRMMCISRDNDQHLISSLHSSGDSVNMMCFPFCMPSWPEQVACWDSVAT